MDGHLSIGYNKDKEIIDTNEYKNNKDHYGFEVNSNYMIIGDKDFKSDPNYMGHLINDGAKTNLDPKSIEIYNKVSTLMANCKFHRIKDYHVVIVATKNINKGEELLITYGSPYWDSYNKKNKSEC